MSVRITSDDFWPAVDAAIKEMLPTFAAEQRAEVGPSAVLDQVAPSVSTTTLPSVPGVDAPAGVVPRPPGLPVEKLLTPAAVLGVLALAKRDQAPVARGVDDVHELVRAGLLSEDELAERTW